MAEKYIQVGSNIVVGSLSGDIGKLVDSLSILVFSVKNCQEKCKALKEKVDSVHHELLEMERQMILHPQKFNPTDHSTNLIKFFMVLKDCIAKVERHNGMSFIVRVLLSLKLESEFDALDQRLEQCMRFFKLDISVTTVITTIQIQEELQILLNSTLHNFEEVHRLLNTNRKLDEVEGFPLQGITCGKPIFGGYMIAGKLKVADSDTAAEVLLMSSQQQQKKNEVTIIKLLSDSENILRFYGTWCEGANQYLVMERPGREIITLDEWIKKKNINDNELEDNRSRSTSMVLMDVLNEWRVKRLIALEITTAVAYIHCAGVLHRSLRSPHIFLTDDLRPKLFGFFGARTMANPSEKRWTPLEQIRWAAPEMLPKDRPEFSKECDIFSLGVMIWEIITNDYPFSDIDSATKLLKERISRKRALQFPSSSSDLHQSQFYKVFCQVSLDCMNEIPESRPDLGNVIERLESLAPEQILV